MAGSRPCVWLGWKPRTGEQSVTLGRFTLLSDLTSRTVFRGDEEGIAGTRNARETLNLNGTRRSCFLDGFAVLVHHGANAAISRARNDGVTDAEGSRLDEHGCHSATAFVEASLDGNTAGSLVRVGAQVETSICGEQNGIKKSIDVQTGESRDVDEHDVSSVLLSDQTKFGELLTNLGRVGVGLVDLVDSNNDGHASGLGVVQSLDGLRHDAVVGRDNENRDVGGLGTTGTHGGKRFVARGVNEGDGAFDAFVHGVNLVRTDVLRDSTGFASDNICLADAVEKARLSMVDVSHDGNDGGTNLKIFVCLVFQLLLEVDVEGFEKLFVFLFGADNLNLEAELLAQNEERSLIEGLGCRCHLTEVEKDGNQVAGAGVNLVGEVRNRGAATQTDDCRAVATRNAYATQRGGFA